MSKGGVGRGRGWLNLSRSQNTPINPVGNVPNTPAKEKNNIDDANYIDVSNQNIDMVNKIKHLNLNDDGIKFNQKMKYILENWKQNCQTSKQVEESFDTLYKESLKDAELASKLVLMVSSRSFISQEIHDQNIRLLFLRKLQNNFEGCKELQMNNSCGFRNSVQLLGEFYNKARLGNGKQLTFMAAPLLSYLEMLLEAGQCQDLQLFTTQLHLNGSSVKIEFPDKIANILNTARLTLVSEKNLSRESRLWLLLAIEIAGNGFTLLPTNVLKFFEEQLGEVAMTRFQTNAASCMAEDDPSVETHNSLSVQTADNKILDNYQSNVNVLQVSSNDTALDPKSSSSSLDYNTQTHNKSSGLISESSSIQNSSRRDHLVNTSGKCGRPILGIGVRLNKGKLEEASSNTNWRDRDNTMARCNKSKNWDDGKKITKGWDHDDRFENDYS